MMHRFSLDAWLFVFVLVAAGWWGKHCVDIFSALGHTPSMYNEQFEPAVMMACGHGFQRAVDPPVAVARFLTRKDDRFSCDALAADLKMQTGKVAEGSWLYLLMLVVGAWRLLGISWSGLSPLLGLFFGMTTAFAYAVFRFGMGRIAALACSGALALSTLQVLSLPAFRDYAKAPVMIALAAIVFALVLRPFQPRKAVALCACYGALVGFGYGLKPDTLIQLPVLVVAVLLFLPGGVRANLRLKAGGLGAAFLAFFLTISPVVRATPFSGNNLWHVALIGFMPEYDTALGVGNPMYRWGVTGSDEYVYLATRNYVRRIHPDWPDPSMYTFAYQEATKAYLLEFSRRFPADIGIRGVSSITRIPEVAFGWPQRPLAGLLDFVYSIRERALTPLYGIGLPLALIALTSITLVDVRRGLFLWFLFVYLGAYPTIQFHNRNFFHLEVIGWLVIGFLASQLFDLAMRRRWPIANVPARALARRFAAGVLAFGLCAAALLPLRAYQTRVFRRTVNDYVRAVVHPLDLEQSDSEGTHSAAVPAFRLESQDPDWSRLIRLDMRAGECVGGTVTYQYDRNSAFRGLTTTVPLPSSSKEGVEPLILFQPVYSGFASVDLRATSGSCLQSVSEVTGLDAEPLWIPMVLDAAWRSRPAYQWLQTRENIH